MNELSGNELEMIGFTNSKKELPRAGVRLVCYHKIYGLQYGFWCGENSDTQFLLPAMIDAKERYNWATHWKYVN